jgi:histidinol-phosphate/aromatic aminotransferase/cobyric acid decarboxylase-like protein
VDFRADPDSTEHLRIKTGTNYEKQRAIKALRSVADFLESKLE